MKIRIIAQCAKEFEVDNISEQVFKTRMDNMKASTVGDTAFQYVPMLVDEVEEEKAGIVSGIDPKIKKEVA